MAKLKSRGAWYWAKFDPNDKGSGAALAQIRKGVGRPAGSVPELWRYHKAVISDYEAKHGVVSQPLVAEHAALTLFAVHQQSQEASMHLGDEHLGAALRKLRASKQFKDNPEALDRRVNAAATATSVAELVHHLRGLITLLRGQHLPIDYTQLAQDIADWHHPDTRARARGRWGAQYYTWNSATAPATAE
jgi:CRISPR system Cascade subunit CasB